MRISKYNLISKSERITDNAHYVKLFEIEKAIHTPSNDNNNHKYSEPSFHIIKNIFKFEKYYDEVNIFVYSVFPQNGGCNVHVESSTHNLIDIIVTQDDNKLYFFARSKINSRYICESMVVSSDNPSYIKGFFYNSAIYEPSSLTNIVESTSINIVNPSNTFETNNVEKNQYYKLFDVKYTDKNGNVGGKGMFKIKYSSSQLYNLNNFFGSIILNISTSKTGETIDKKIKCINYQTDENNRLNFEIYYKDSGNTISVFIKPILSTTSINYKLDTFKINNPDQITILIDGKNYSSLLNESELIKGIDKVVQTL